MQAAIARRETVPRSVSAAIAEVGSAEACLDLIENSGADIAAFSLDRIVERFGHLAAIRESLLAWPDLPVATRQALVVKLSETLAGFVVARNWLEEGRAQRIAQEACEKATVMLAAASENAEVSPLISHLRADRPADRRPGAALAALRQHRLLRAGAGRTGRACRPRASSALVHDRRGAGFKAVYERAGLPASVYPAFRAAIEVMHETGFVAEPGGTTRLQRRMVERVLTSCARMPAGDVEPLMTLLRRYATEAAREEARLFCDELVEMGNAIERIGRARRNDHRTRRGRRPKAFRYDRNVSVGAERTAAAQDRFQRYPAGRGSRGPGIRPSPGAAFRRALPRSSCCRRAYSCG